jgi:hypothetical protein
MITTAQQLKALVRNLSKGDSVKAQMFMRSYAVERFLERLSLSPYRESFILKGGTLVASLVGFESRTTIDIDATVKSLCLLSLTETEARVLVGSIV